MNDNITIDTFKENEETKVEPSNWIERVAETFLKNRIKRDLKAAAKVHPCMINGQRVLVYQFGLQESDPDAYLKLEQYSEKNGFAIKEDARVKENKPVQFERRMAKTLPLLFLASGIFMSGVASASVNDSGTLGSGSGISVMPDIEITATMDSNDRAYSQEDGNRFITNPYGETESILAVAAQTKANGTLKRVSTRGIKMPSGYVGGFINKYEHTFENGNTFSYYEGEGFGALGYHADEGKVVLDVLVGGGAFSAPKLWGPYDQILGDKDNSSMQLMMGDGEKDGMGLLKASYAIGYTAVMAEEDYSKIGNDYGTAVNDTITNIIASGGAPDLNIASAIDINDRDKS
ncbi:MAG: DUF3579 domain-containing protein [Gammaproteobacteria bacterium]|jgi:hypothetical protein